MTNANTEALEALDAAEKAYKDFAQKRAAMNAAIPALDATPAERALYDERYQADHEAERENFRTALVFAKLSAETGFAGIIRAALTREAEAVPVAWIKHDRSITSPVPANTPVEARHPNVVNGVICNYAGNILSWSGVTEYRVLSPAPARLQDDELEIALFGWMAARDIASPAGEEWYVSDVIASLDLHERELCDAADKGKIEARAAHDFASVERERDHYKAKLEEYRTARFPSREEVAKTIYEACDVPEGVTRMPWKEFAADWQEYAQRFYCQADAVRALLTQGAQTTNDGALREGATSYRYALNWIAAPRPPVHPTEMEGNQTFLTFDKAVTFMSKQAPDARFVSLSRITTTVEDVSEMARKALSNLTNGEG
jgi:hypothetical protein